MDSNVSTVTNQTASSGDHLTVYESSFYITSGTVGTVFNALVLFIALKYVDTDDKPRQLIVINMTAADFLFSIVYMLTRPYLSTFASFMCHPYYILIWTVQLCSTLNLVWLNLDKLIYIQFPLHYYSIVSKKRIMILSVATWVVLGTIALFVSFFMSAPDGCSRVRLDMNIYLPICILYAVMILASFVISAVIYFIAHSSTKMEARQRTKLFQRLFFLFSSTLWTFFTCLPYRVLYLTNTLCTSCRTQVMIELTDIFFRILVVGTVINPLITIWTQRIYRMRLIKLISKWHETYSDDMTTTVITRRQSSRGTLIENVALTTNL